jgi:cysteinyl-tRNA synthetase
MWIDHDPGAAAARNLALRASRGTFVALLDPSVELLSDPWPGLLSALRDRSVGGVGPFGLVTADMRHFHEVEPGSGPHPASDGAAARDVDALQNYLMVFRRADLTRIGPLDEHFRFYRILDLDLSYAIRDRVGRLLTLDGLPLARHRHALWESLGEGDREERSRKNFGRFLKRWDHRHDLHRHADAAALAGPATVHG